MDKDASLSHLWWLPVILYIVFKAILNLE